MERSNTKQQTPFFIFCDQSRRPIKTPFGNVVIVGWNSQYDGEEVCVPGNKLLHSE